MKLLLKKARSISVFILAISLIGCGDDDESKLPKVVSGFTQTIDEDTGTTRFINVSTNADTYLWDFGDEETSTEINPVKSYAASGDYTVTLTATNLAGLSDVFKAVLTIVVKDQIALPITFDDGLVIYTETVFSGASFEIVDNPAAGGSNDVQSKVGALTNIGAEFEGLFFDLGADVDLEVNKSITMNFWSDKAIDVLIKLEEGTGSAVEAIASHTGTTGWEHITFDFESAGSFSRLTLFVDGPGNTAGTFYLDDIIQTETIDTTPPVITLVGDDMISVVLGSTYTDAGATAMDNFDGDISGQIVTDDMVDTNVEGVYTVTYDVTDAAGNEATTVSRTVDVIGADIEKPVIELEGANPFNLTLNEAYVEPGYTANDNIDGVITSLVVVDESALDNTTVGEYDITYNVSDAAGNDAEEVKRRVIVSAGGGGCTGTVVVISALPASFEACESFISTFSNDGSITTELAENPSKTGINTSDFSMKVVKSTGTNRWAGLQNIFSSNLDLTKTFKVKIYSSKANTVFKFEVNSDPQDAGSGNPGPQYKTITQANTWEEVEVFFTGIPPSNTGVNQLVIKPDNPDGSDGELTATTETYYFDDIILE